MAATGPGDDLEARSSDEQELPHAARRTLLASERTELAWWRTGLTALAVALAVWRVIPDLRGGGARWPYALVGAGFALYGAALIAYGSLRGISTEREVGVSPRSRSALLGLSALGIVLSVATLVLVLVD